MCGVADGRNSFSGYGGTRFVSVSLDSKSTHTFDTQAFKWMSRAPWKMLTGSEKIYWTGTAWTRRTAL
jgi:hypothetical protein